MCWESTETEVLYGHNFSSHQIYKRLFSQVKTDDPEIIGSGDKTEISDNYDQYDDYEVVYAPGIYGEDTSDVNMAHLDQAYAN